MNPKILLFIFSGLLVKNVYSMKQISKLKKQLISSHMKDMLAKKKDQVYNYSDSYFDFHLPNVERESYQNWAWQAWHNARKSFETKKKIYFDGKVIESSIIPLQSYKIIRYAPENRKKEIVGKDDFINTLEKYFCPGYLHNFEDKEIIIAAKKKDLSSIVTVVTVTDEDTNCVLFMHIDPSEEESQYGSRPTKGHDFLIHKFIELYHRPGITKTSLTLVCPGEIRQRGPWNLLVPAHNIAGRVSFMSDEYIRNQDISFTIVTHGAQEEKNKQSHNVKLIIPKSGVTPELQTHFSESMEYPLDYFFTDRIRAANERKLELGYLLRANKKLEQIFEENERRLKNINNKNAQISCEEIN